jgi:[ribosomal protein S18]-alanine N-acetyltransferase
VDFVIKQLWSAADLSTCASLMAESNPWNKLYFSKEQCEAQLSRPEIRVHGAVGQEETILGFLASAENGIGFEPMIEFLCVDQRFRGKGIGTRLIAFFEEELFPDADNLYLFVSDINPNAMRLYVRQGYSQVGALPNFDLEMQTEFLYRKTRRPRQARYRTHHSPTTWL